MSEEIDEAFKPHHWYSRANENWTWVCADCGKVWRPALTPPVEECFRSVAAQNVGVLEEKSNA